MAKLTQTHNIVYEILLTKEETRNDDFLLIYEVLKTFKVENTSTEFVVKNHIGLGIPSFETITRCRRKIQEQHPALKGVATTKQRQKEEKEFREYALNIK